MGLFSNIFGKGDSGGVMNVIRCDEPEYLVWKWRPNGQEVNSTSRENAIRYGSTLVVKPGEVAVFQYRAPGGGAGGMDFIEGPYQDTIKTANFPVLANLMGMAFGGDSPFQAEVYFMNLQGNNQLKFGVPYFEVVDPRNIDLPVPVAVRGTLTFNLTDYKAFINLNRLQNFDLEQLTKQIQDCLRGTVKQVVSTIPTQYGIPLVNIGTQLFQVRDIIKQYLSERFAGDFGINLKALDISAIELDKDTQAYRTLKAITQDISVSQVKQQADIAARTNEMQANLAMKNLQDTQRINTEHMEETLRIQREEGQRSGRMRTQTAYPQANILDKQVQMMGLAAQGMQGASVNMGNGGGMGMNPGAAMMGMAVGGAMGGQMAGMMNQMGQQMQNTMNTPPPMPTSSYHVAVNGQQYGPFDMTQLQQMAQQGQLTPDTMVWTQGMPSWAPAKTVSDLSGLFMPPAMGGTPPPMPGGGTPPPTL